MYIFSQRHVNAQKLKLKFRKYLWKAFEQKLFLNQIKEAILCDLYCLQRVPLQYSRLAKRPVSHICTVRIVARTKCTSKLP